MSHKQKLQIYPLISVVIIIIALFSLVFLQMEVRRIGYVLLKETRQYKSLQDEHRLKVMRFAKVMRPERLRDLAVTRLTLNDAKSSQIIHMAGEKIALRQ
ncbi:MAG: histidine kinase [Bdellovibrionales bacterium]|nr:histidine kinase [Bdellovibrionales bacterium]